MILAKSIALFAGLVTTEGRQEYDTAAVAASLEKPWISRSLATLLMTAPSVGSAAPGTSASAGRKRGLSVLSSGGTLSGPPGSFLRLLYGTADEAKLKLGIGDPLTGTLSLSYKDPPRPGTGKPSYDATATYMKNIEGFGEIDAKVSHAGDWMARLTSEMEGPGKLQAAIENNNKWSIQVDKSFASDKKLAPSVTYGVNEGGAHAKLKMAYTPSEGARALYEVANKAGEYAVKDVQQSASLSVTTADGNHMLEATAKNDGGSDHWKPTKLKYTAKGDDKSLESTLTDKGLHSKLALQKDKVKLTAEVEGKRPVDLGMTFGKVVRDMDVHVNAHLQDGKPKFKFGVGSQSED